MRLAFEIIIMIVFQSIFYLKTYQNNIFFNFFNINISKQTKII